MLSKKELRQQFCAKRAALSAAEQKSASFNAIKKLLTHAVFQNAQTIALYLPHQGEIDISALFQQQNKQYYLPVLDPDQSQHLLFVKYSLNEPLQLNRYKILEPPLNKNKILSAQQLDLVLMPLVAFDLQGHRLGMGAGYYDFTFAFLNTTSRPVTPYLMGLAYEWQRVNNLAAEKWDVKLNAVITDKNLYETGEII